MKKRSRDHFTRRDFFRVAGGSLVAWELGLAGCSDDDSGGSGQDAGAPQGGTGAAPYGGTGGGVSGSGGSGGVGGVGGTGVGGSGATGAGAGGSPTQPPGMDGGSPNDGGSTQQPVGGVGGAEPPVGGEGPAGSGAAGTEPQPTVDAGAGTGGSSGDPDASTQPPGLDAGDSGKSRVYIVQSADRLDGIANLLSMTDLGFATGRQVVLKPNFNSADPAPASTHDDHIRAVVNSLKGVDCGDITLGESSGPGGTPAVTAALGTLGLCDDLGIAFVDFDDTSRSPRETFDFDGNGWRGGLDIPAMMRADDRAVVLLPCCKTHSIGHFTMSLKLAVGLVEPGRRMSEMHMGDIRSLIADINYGFTPDLVVMDAIRCFITRGPTSGTLAEPGLLVASQDRVALDAVGVAILKRAGSTETAIRRNIFQQDQIVRAVEIGLGASSPDEIELVGNDDAVISELRGILDQG